MDNLEFYEFLKVTLIKIENAINLINQETPEFPKHILAYNKMLGVHQKLSQLDEEYRNYLFPQMVGARSVISYFLNGNYEEAYNRILKLKKDIVNICLDLERNEKDRNEKLQKD